MNSTNIKLLLLFALGSILWFVPIPEGLTVQAWKMMVIFIVTVLSLILAPLLLGAMALLGLTAATLLDVIPLKTALSGFAQSPVPTILTRRKALKTASALSWFNASSSATPLPATCF